jgi:hypothetical protein
MGRALGLLLLALLAPATSSCGPALFTSRVDVAPFLEKLRTAGGSPDRILHPHTLADLGPLESGKRYKFVVLGGGELAVAPLPADAPDNQYVHPVLAGGAPVRTAGGITVTRDGDAIREVVVDQDSKAYCPTRASLAAATRAVTALGLPKERVHEADRPPQCGGLM